MSELDLVLTEEEEAVFFGNLLGDGHVQKRGNSFRSKIEHCFEHEEYVLWKYQKLKRLCENNHLPKKTITKKKTESSLFYLKSGKYLGKYHTLFYESYIRENNELENDLMAQYIGVAELTETNLKEEIRYRKVITETLIEALPKNPLVLAVWFLDDGSRRDDVFSGKLATQGFTKDEQKLLQDYLQMAFGIKTNLVLHSKAKSQYYLSIPARNKQFSNLVDIIEPLVKDIKCMQYKWLK